MTPTQFTQLQVVTVSTAPQHKYQQMQKNSAKKWGYAYTSLGQNVDWKGFDTWMDILLAYFEAETDLDDPTKLYAVVDAYDLVFTGPPGELLEKYNAMDAPLVAGADRICFGNCQPPTCESPDPVPDRKYVNGGCLLGPAAHLYALLLWERDNYPADNQNAISRYRNAYCDTVQLDTEASIVLNLAPYSWMSQDALDPVDDARFRLRKTGVMPVMVHCPHIFQDLGARWDFLMDHIQDDYVPVHTKGQLFHSLAKHATTLVRTNKSYLVFTLAVCYGVFLLLIGVICAGVFGFQSLMETLHAYENGL